MKTPKEIAEMQKEYYESEQKRFSELQSMRGCFFVVIGLIILFIIGLFC